MDAATRTAIKRRWTAVEPPKSQFDLFSQPGYIDEYTLVIGHVLCRWWPTFRGARDGDNTPPAGVPFIEHAYEDMRKLLVENAALRGALTEAVTPRPTSKNQSLLECAVCRCDPGFHAALCPVPRWQQVLEE